MSGVKLINNLMMASYTKMKYFEVNIIQTGKIPFSKKEFEVFNEKRLTFATLEQIKTFLANEYQKVKKTKMYIDDKEGNPKQVGWVYCFKNSDISHNSPIWLQKDWVEINEITSKRIIL
jgi:hypothetical protein